MIQNLHIKANQTTISQSRTNKQFYTVSQ